MSDTAKHLQELQEAEASLKAAFENYRTVALRASASLPSKPQQPSSSSEADRWAEYKRSDGSASLMELPPKPPPKEGK